MQLQALFTSLVAFSSAVVLAAPHGQASNAPCCCCDSSLNRIACDYSLLASECVCAAVVCPQGAPTVYINGPTPTATTTPEATILPIPEPEDEEPPVVIIDPFWPFIPFDPTPVLGSLPPVPSDPNFTPVMPGKPPGIPFDMPPPGQVHPTNPVLPAEPQRMSCCCCDPERGANVCRMRAQDDCICTAVACLDDAPYVWE